MFQELLDEIIKAVYQSGVQTFFADSGCVLFGVLNNNSQNVGSFELMMCFRATMSQYHPKT